MNRTEIGVKAQAIVGTVEELRKRWRRAQRASVYSGSQFYQCVETTRNVLDGRCPDGCCGGEGRPRWRPTPAEWVAIAEYVQGKQA